MPTLDCHSAQKNIWQSRSALDIEFDSVAELWWKSFEDLAEASRTEAGVRASAELLEDEKRFIDLSRSAIWYGQEREIISMEK